MLNGAIETDEKMVADPAGLGVPINRSNLLRVAPLGPIAGLRLRLP
jgi:hypothetical protein